MKTRKFLVVDYEAGLETARRLQEDGNEVYYYSPWDKAYAEWWPYAKGDGFGVPKVKHWATVIDKVDYVVFPEGNGHMADWLREKGYRVFGPNTRGESLEQDRLHAKRVFKDLGVDFPRTYQATGVQEALDYLEGHKGGHFLKLNTFRGDLETVKVDSADEAEAFFCNLHTRLGPFSKSIPIIIEEEVEGCYIGVDSFFNGDDWYRPFLFGFEDFGADAIEKAAEHTPFDETFDRLRPFFQEIGYRGPFSLEGILTEDGRVFVIDPSSRFPFTLSMIYINHLKNFSDVIAGTADGEDVVPEYESKYAVNLNMTIEEKTGKPGWFVVDHPKDVKVRYINAAKMNGKVYVHTGDYKPSIVVTAMRPTIQEAFADAEVQMGKVKVIHGQYNDSAETTFLLEYIEPFNKMVGEAF